MNDENKSERTIQRREVIKGAAAAGLVAATGPHSLALAAQPNPASSELIIRENAKTGTRDWMLTKTRLSPERSTNPGQRALHVDRRLLLREQCAGW